MRWALLATLWACGGGDRCKGCEEGEVCVAHLAADDTVDHRICAAVPPACGARLDCADNPCVLEAYALCDVGYVGAFCDDQAGNEPALTCYEED